MRLRTIKQLRQERDLAMARARFCREVGMDDYAIDVKIARSLNRELLRVAR
jgi:hypothetical protein